LDNFEGIRLIVSHKEVFNLTTMFERDHNDSAAPFNHVILTLAKDKKYFVVADSLGYLSIVGK
jgi:hypothetical protein